MNDEFTNHSSESPRLTSFITKSYNGLSFNKRMYKYCSQLKSPLQNTETTAVFRFMFFIVKSTIIFFHSGLHFRTTFLLQHLNILTWIMRSGKVIPLTSQWLNITNPVRRHSHPTAEIQGKMDRNFSADCRSWSYWMKSPKSNSKINRQAKTKKPQYSDRIKMTTGLRFEV